jgi:hypothetical protein
MIIKAIAHVTGQIYQTVAKDLDFRGKMEAICRWLANKRKLLFRKFFTAYPRI